MYIRVTILICILWGPVEVQHSSPSQNIFKSLLYEKCGKCSHLFNFKYFFHTIWRNNYTIFKIKLTGWRAKTCLSSCSRRMTIDGQPSNTKTLIYCNISCNHWPFGDRWGRSTDVVSTITRMLQCDVFLFRK